MAIFDMTRDDSFVVYSKFDNYLRIGRRSLEELIASEYRNTDVLSPRQMKINEWLPRVGGVISFLSALFMLIMAWKRRGRLYHNLIIGMSFHLLVQGAFLIYGTLAIPISAIDEALKASGTTTTCTVQGFFIYTCGNIALWYYSFFSLHSYFHVLNNFDKTKYLLIEWLIHVVVHIYPIGSALYFLTIEGFNNTGYGSSGYGNSPLGCEEDNSNVPCERGPHTEEKLRKLQWFGIASDIFYIIFPTIVMVILYLKVQQRQAEIHIQSRTVAFQSMIYLVVTFIVNVPFLIGQVLELESKGLVQYYFYISAMFLISILGFLTLLVYIYFSVPTDLLETNITDINSNRSKRNYIFNADNNEQENTTNPTSSTNAATSPSSAEAETGTTRKKSSSKYSFNIFDGTNANGAFSEFVHAGDSDDERVDNRETMQWSSVQQHT